MVLSEIYDYVLKEYPYFVNSTCAWRNSVRHNLSVNECFRKSRAAKSGRGFYWALHEACVEDFRRGEFNRRQARSRVQHATRRHHVTNTDYNNNISKDYNNDHQNQNQWGSPHVSSPFPRAQSYVPMTSTPARGYPLNSRHHNQ